MASASGVRGRSQGHRTLVPREPVVVAPHQGTGPRLPDLLPDAIRLAVVSAALVTGARGFAGSHLVEYLDSCGVTVTGWTRQEVDLLDREAVSHAIAKLRPTFVYHCAGVAHVGQSFDNIGDTFAANVLGTQHLFEALRRSGLRSRVLITGSSLVDRKSVV